MATVLEPGNKIKRLLHVYGVEGLVEVTVAHEGIFFRIPKTKKSVLADWRAVIDRSTSTPNDVPSHLIGRPLEVLQHEADKVQKRKERRAAK